MKKLLITGASGFIGKHVVSLLKAEGHEVRGISRSDGDFANPDFCDHIIEGCQAVIHLAWSTTPHSSSADPIADVESNVQGSISLFQASLRAGVEKVVFVSSGGTVYGTPERVPIRETDPILPVSSYGITKATVERYLHFFHQNEGLNYVALRGANAYGPGQNFSPGQGVIGYWLKCIMAGKPITVYGDGSQVRDFLYISDFAGAISRAVQWSGAASTCNIGSEAGYSLIDIIDSLKRVTGAAPEIEFTAPRQYDVPRNILDCSRAKSLLNWEAKVGLEEGIQKTWEWMQTQETRDV